MEESNSKYLITDLKDTVDLMNSEDHEDRFKAEYYQTKIRLEKLHDIIIKMEAGKLDFEPKCPRNVLKYQENCMIQYLNQLEIRAEYEGIVLVK